MKVHHCLIYILLFSTISCENQNERRSSPETKEKNNNENFNNAVNNSKHENRKIAKAVYYLENSGSMFGYVNGFTEYVDVVSDIAEKPKFVEEKTSREFNFVNGGQNISIIKIGDDPALLKNKLNVKGFNVGDVSKSNLNSMFQLALSRAKNDTISILISDGIYDVGNQQIPVNALSIEGRETRSRFIERLNEGGLQTIIIKLSSQFEGKYFPVKGGSVNLSQQRPYYMWIFGESELLNEYFSEPYLKSLNGYTDYARFMEFNNINIPYQATTQDKIGDFKFDKQNKNKLTGVSPDRNGRGFQFSFATDFSSLPFSNTYYGDVSNFSITNENYSISKVQPIGDLKIYGLNFNPKNLISVYTAKNPLGKLEISLLNKIPNWIGESNIENEDNIVGDSTHTFGFKFLTDAINEAYLYKTQESKVITFNFELLK